MTNDGNSSNRDEQARRLAESLKRQLGTLCPLLLERNVVELMLNPDGRVWADRLGQPMQPVGSMAASTAESFIATVASTLRSAVTRENPILECELPQEPPFDGSRFEALIPPVVPAPVFSTRSRRWPSAPDGVEVAILRQAFLTTLLVRQPVQHGTEDRPVAGWATPSMPKTWRSCAARSTSSTPRPTRR